ncbi:MAG TPA: RNA polymerase sigma factor [Micromonosporaceae bacterium]
MAPTEPAAVIEAVWRLENARIVGALTRLVRDVGMAEECAQDALVAALEEWPDSGVPANPGGWLMLAAKHRAIDRLRRADNLTGKIDILSQEYAQRQRTDIDTGGSEYAAILDDDGLQDDVLRLVFVACHPVLPTPSRVALTLRLLGGLTTEEIARAFLVPEPTVAQRIVRAKRMLAEKAVRFEVPAPVDRPARLGSVLEVLYLIFNEGHSATTGDEWVRPEMCFEALRLGRMLAELASDEPEVHGLVALMEIQASRLRARVDASGRPVPLAEQNRGRWDQLLIRRGFAALLRARALDRPFGPYVLQAAIAACHARAGTPEATDWPSIVALYEQLDRVAPSPVLTVNHAVALAMTTGPASGLRLLDGVSEVPAMATYHLLPAVRGDLLARLGRRDEARHEFERAAALTANARERAVLVERARSLD